MLTENKRFAAIDVGSNAIRLLMMQSVGTSNNFPLKKISLIRVPIRLGSDVFSKGKISKEKKNLLMEAFKGFRALLNACGINHYRACATSAMREATNGAKIVKAIKTQSQISLEIISGQQEAQIIFDGGIASQIDDGKAYLFVDVGGGSTEITLFNDHKVIDSNSFQIGTVRMLENKVLANEWGILKNWLQQLVINQSIEFIIGSGGNINRLTKMANNINKTNRKISYQQIRQLYKSLSNCTYEERIEQFNLPPDRADVIVPACFIFKTIMKTTKIEEVMAPRFSLSDGIIKQLFTLNRV